MSRARRSVDQFTVSVDQHETGGSSALPLRTLAIRWPCNGSPPKGGGGGCSAAARGNLIRVLPAQGGWGASAASNGVKDGTNNEYSAIFVGGGVIGLASAW